MQLLHKIRTGGSDISHIIFQKIPADTERLLSECRFESVSGWALDLLLDQYKDRQADLIADFYYHISAMPEAATLRGHLFERLVLNCLRGIRTEYTFPIRGLTDSKERRWTYRGHESITFEELTAFDIITKAVQCRTPLHLVPLARNFAAVDSIVYDPNKGLTCIKITLDSDNPIAVSGLQRIQRWLRLSTSLAALRPNRAKPWRFVASGVKHSSAIGLTRPTNTNKFSPPFEIRQIDINRPQVVHSFLCLSIISYIRCHCNVTCICP
jgi:hypothetical protein